MLKELIYFILGWRVRVHKFKKKFFYPFQRFSLYMFISLHSTVLHRAFSDKCTLYVEHRPLHASLLFPLSPPPPICTLCCPKQEYFSSVFMLQTHTYIYVKLRMRLINSYGLLGLISNSASKNSHGNRRFPWGQKFCCLKIKWLSLSPWDQSHTGAACEWNDRAVSWTAIKT